MPKKPPACKHPNGYKQRPSTGAYYCRDCGAIRSKCVDDTGQSWVADPVPIYKQAIKVEDAPDPTAPKGTNGHGPHEPEAA